ncbi:hypothetical protein I3843_02G046300 [Carya illinoinensis]|nr:hypothetical protein I3843_02G046300 [Carya illinoinensis]
MASKSAVFVLLMVVVAVAAPIAVAQLGTVGRLLDRIRIQGTVFCSINATGSTASPVFPNARVQLRCGIGDVVSRATTNRIRIVLDAVHSTTNALFNLGRVQSICHHTTRQVQRYSSRCGGLALALTVYRKHYCWTY